MKTKIRIVKMDPLPRIRIRINVDPIEGLRRLEAIARANNDLKVQSNYEGDGRLHSNWVFFASRKTSRHKGLFAMFVSWKRHGRD